MKVLASENFDQAMFIRLDKGAPGITFREIGKVFYKVKLSADDVVRFEVLDENSAKSLAGSAGWAIAAGVLTGGIGAIVGAIAGGNRHDRIVALEDKEGRKAIIQISKGEHKKLAPFWAKFAL